MPSFAQDIREHPPASLMLERLLSQLPQDRVSLGWLHDHLHERSFEMLAFVMALIGVLPGASVMIGALMVVPAFGMMFSSGIKLPSIVASRSVSARQASFVIERAILFLRTCKTESRPTRRVKRTRPLVGALLLLLGITLLVPVPFSNVFPALAIAGLSLASFEDDFLLLCLSELAAIGSLAVTGVTVLAASQALAKFAF